MEALGAVKVIGGILEHVKTVVNFVNDIKNATEDRKKLLDEALATETVLTQLQAHAEEEEWKATMEALTATSGPFEQLELELERMTKKLHPSEGKLFKARKALEWPFSKDGIKKHFDRIERIKGLLQIALANNHRFVLFTLRLNFRELTKAVKEDLAQVKQMMKGKLSFHSRLGANRKTNSLNLRVKKGGK
jgi:hypothetical protein